MCLESNEYKCNESRIGFNVNIRNYKNIRRSKFLKRKRVWKPFFTILRLLDELFRVITLLFIHRDKTANGKDPPPPFAIFSQTIHPMLSTFDLPFTGTEKKSRGTDSISTSDSFLDTPDITRCTQQQKNYYNSNTQDRKNYFHFHEGQDKIEIFSKFIDHFDIIYFNYSNTKLHL